MWYSIVSAQITKTPARKGETQARPGVNAPILPLSTLSSSHSNLSQENSVSSLWPANRDAREVP